MHHGSLKAFFPSRATSDQAPPPRRQTPAFETALEDADAVSRSLIPLHRIAGPVLLISGEDDALWPSTRFAGIAEQRLRAAGHPFVVRHISYPDAGHTIEYPFRPCTVLARALTRFPASCSPSEAQPRATRAPAKRRGEKSFASWCRRRVPNPMNRQFNDPRYRRA